LDVTILNAHAPTEDKYVDKKGKVYMIEQALNQVLKHHFRILLGDCNKN